MAASDGTAEAGVSRPEMPAPDRRARLRRIPRALRALSPRNVVVFVSSPGDCVAERDIARLVVAKVNTHPDVQRQRLTFRAFRWEDLPPGEAEKKDFQGRINALMRRYGYDDYGIYLGIFKGRLGTPTPRYRSGTIEEFEGSRVRKRRLGSPSEILLYFIDPEASSVPAVAQYRSELTERGFLLATVSAATFADRLEGNLLDIARSWNRFRNLVERIAPKIGRLFGATAVLLLLLFAGVDAVSYLQIKEHIQSGDLQGAATLWRERSLVMPVGHRDAQAAINAALAEAIQSEAALGQRLAALSRWQGDVAFDKDHPAISDLRAVLAGQTRAALETAAASDQDPSAFTLWQHGKQLGLWSAEETGNLLSTVSSSRLIGALVSSGFAPEEWGRKLLRPFERDGLKRFAQRVIEAQADPARWSQNRLRRVGVAVLAGNDGALELLADAALLQPETFDQPELTAWIALGPEAGVAEWIRRTIKPATPPFMTGKMVDAVRMRGSPVLVAALVDRALQPDAPADLGAQVEELGCPAPGCSSFANARITSWAESTAPMQPVLAVLLPELDPAALEAATRDRIVSRLAAALGGEEATAIIAALSKFGTEAAEQALDAHRERHAARDISFGFAERAALIDDLAARTISDGRSRLAEARRLVVVSEADQDSINQSSSALPGGGMIALVDQAYLKLLADQRGAAGEQDLAVLARIVERSQSGNGALLGIDLGLALGRALRALPEEWTLGLLNFPPPPLLSPPWDPAWDRRRVILGAMQSVDGRPMPAVAEAVLASRPNDAQMAGEIEQAAAKLCADVGKPYFRKRLAEGSDAAIATLARLGDQEAVLQYAQTAAGRASATEIPEVLIDAIRATPAPSDRKALVELLLQNWPGPVRALLSVAAIDRIDDPKLRAEAEAALSHPQASAAATAVGYLAALDPALPWQIAAKPAARAALEKFLGEAEPFDWTMVAQAFPLGVPAAQVPSEAVPLATVRSIADVLAWGDVSDDAADAGILLLPDGKIVVNHLLAAVAAQGEPAPSLAAISTLLQADRPATLSLPDGQTIFSAYLNWLAAAPLHAAQPDCLPPALMTAERLIDSNALVVRAAAALALAAPTASATGRCAGG